MGKFCSKCGNELSDGAIFCSSCGIDANIAKQKQEVQTPDENIVVETATTTVKTKKKKTLKIIIPIVALFLVVAVVIGIIFVTNSRVVTTNSRGEQVFNFTAEDYVKRYNKANKGSSETMNFSDFQKVHNDGGFDEAGFPTIKEKYYTASLDDGHVDLYLNYIDDFSANIVKIEFHYYDRDDLWKGAEKILKALYPYISNDKAHDLIVEAKTSDDAIKYKDIIIKHHPSIFIPSFEFTPNK